MPEGKLMFDRKNTEFKPSLFNGDHFAKIGILEINLIQIRETDDPADFIFELKGGELRSIETRRIQFQNTILE